VVKRKSQVLILTNFETGVLYYHPVDEDMFFKWLASIPCVESYAREGSDGLVVRLKRRPGRDDLRQLIALLYRYGADMRQLAKFETAKNRDWFRNPKAFWHKAVFGKRRHPGRSGS
jgi:hypothetical protein